MNTKVENEGLESSAKAPEKKLAFGLFGCKLAEPKEPTDPAKRRASNVDVAA